MASDAGLNPNFAFPARTTSASANTTEKASKPLRRPTNVRPPRTTSLQDGGEKQRRHSRTSSLANTLLSHRSSVSLSGLTPQEEALLFSDDQSEKSEAWDFKDDDDALHALTPKLPSEPIPKNRHCMAPAVHGWANVLALVLIAFVMLGIFLILPVADYFHRYAAERAASKSAFAWNLGGTNSSGQVPEIPGMPQLVDPDTPESARTRVGYDGQNYNLVFSDEFNVDGRTFWPGDGAHSSFQAHCKGKTKCTDPYWEAVNLHYWGTGDFEWYNPDAAVTKDGYLVLTLSEQDNHGLNYSSAMIQSWNKLCFTGGYVEVSVQLPGSPTVSGLWPGVWTMGNLGRAGYGATNDGTWSYSYDACDVGAQPNQTYVNGTGPDAAVDTGTRANRVTALSYQPGQRLSACTCPGEDHPGPAVTVGRGAPEIDILEGLIWSPHGTRRGGVSQSAQMAPFDANYNYNQDEPASQIYNDYQTSWNGYQGGHYQEALSAVSSTDDAAYELTEQKFTTYGYEYWPGGDSDAFVTWVAAGNKTWTMTAGSVPAREDVEISQRLITVEPMYLIMNLGISDSFSAARFWNAAVAFADGEQVQWNNLQFPAHMKIDYVRIYQREGHESLTCDPTNYPTSKYIEDHLNAYTNPNLTTWELAGYSRPKQSYERGGCA